MTMDESEKNEQVSQSEENVVVVEEPKNDANTGNVKNGVKDEVHFTNVVSIVCGALSVLSLVIPLLARIGLLLAIIAVIFGIIGKKYPGKGLGRAGMIFGIVTLIIWIILFGMVFMFFGSFIRALAGR